MSSTATTEAPAEKAPGDPGPGARRTATDLQDERLQSREGLSGAVAGVVSRARNGDLGSLPVILGLVVIWGFFQYKNPVFLSSVNLVNLTLECASTGVIALGVVCVLLVGEIDLSVGSVSGLSAAVLAVTFVNKGVSAPLAILAVLALGAAIGFVYAQLFNRLGIPSFVSTLAGLLAFLGLQLQLLGKRGAINLPFGSSLVHFAQLDFLPPALAYALAAVAAGAVLATGLLTAQRRRKAGLSTPSLSLLVLKSAALLVVLEFVVFYLNRGRGRGVGWMPVLFIALVLIMGYLLTRTRWGRSVYAVGGNREAARRAGINVRGTYTSVFMLCSAFAALGGVLAASRLAAATQGSGTGDVNLNAIAAAVIGGTSLFGGRGRAAAALLGIVVIQSISSGLTLLNLSSAPRFMVTGGVLLLAVGLDSVTRRSRTSHGRA